MRSLPLIALVLIIVAPAFAGDAPAKKARLDVKDKLTEKDAADLKLIGSFRKVHEIDLEAGKVYRIDMTSDAIDSYLRLEDPDGKVVATDDDGGGDLNARIVYKAKRTATYKIIASAVKSGVKEEVVGPYRLTVHDAEPRDLVAFKLRDVGSRNSTLREKKAVIAEVVDLLGKEQKLTGQDVNMAFNVAYMLDELPKAEGVGFAEKLKAVFAANDMPNLRELSKIFEGVARRLDLPGNELELTGTLLDGAKLDWKAYRGKVVLIDFWATWCGPCRQEMPHLKKLRETYGDAGFDIVGISADREDDAPAAYMKKNGYDWACVYEKETKRQPMVDRYGIMAFPTTILVGRDGRVLAVDPDRRQLDTLIERAVEKKTP
jgi:thiol-disulfide isomerase/thioredoxin